jgi:hypothetical protein
LEQWDLGKDTRNLWDLQAQSLGAVRSSCNQQAFFVSKLDMTEQKTIIVQYARSAFSPAKGSLKNNFTFYTPMHPARLRCESSEYPDIPAFSRLAGRAPQRLKL